MTPPSTSNCGPKRGANSPATNVVSEELGLSVALPEDGSGIALFTCVRRTIPANTDSLSNARRCVPRRQPAQLIWVATPRRRNRSHYASTQQDNRNRENPVLGHMCQMCHIGNTSNQNDGSNQIQREGHFVTPRAQPHNQRGLPSTMQVQRLTSLGEVS
jgi:hypothetical protein